MKTAIFSVYCITVWLCLQSKDVHAATQCALKIPVPNLNYCDAIGSMEEHVDADLYETKGRVSAVQEYQFDSFKLLDAQITAILDDSTSTGEDIHDVEEEIMTLKRFVNNVLPNNQIPEVNDEIPEVSDSRQKRAAQNPTQQVLNSIKTSFQQSLASVLQKLQTISSSIANGVTTGVALHSKLLQELSTNQQTLTATEQQLIALDQAVRNAVASSGTGGSGVSLSAVTQEVTDLIINGTVAEQVIQRQLDDLDKVGKQLVTNEQRTATKLATFTTDLNDLDTKLTNDTQQTTTLKGAERLYEDTVGVFIYNATRDVANLKADLASTKQSVSQVGRSVFSTTIAIGNFETDLKAFRKSIDGVQSVVTFSQPVQQAQIADILRLKKTLKDNINVLKYAFGLTKTPP